MKSKEKREGGRKRKEKREEKDEGRGVDGLVVRGSETKKK